MNPPRGSPSLVVVLLFCTMVTTTAGCASNRGGRNPPPPPSAQLYLLHLQNGIERARQQMPTITESADTAARRIVSAGGRLYAAGSQPEFASELIARAGGLACIASPPPLVQQFSRNDVVLYATRSRLTVTDRARIARWRDQGAYVIAFASDALSPDPHFRPDVLIDSGGSEGLRLADGAILPTDTVTNLVNAWTWTGEFIAACTQRGRTPIVHQSPDAPGGKERTANYLGRSFHSDIELPPIASGVLGPAYLDRIESGLVAMATSEVPRFQIAGLWLYEAEASSAAVAMMTGPLFPEHFRDERAPQPFAQVIPLSRGVSPAAEFVAVLGSERPPELQIEAAHMRRYKLFYSTVKRGAEDRGVAIAYVDPRWPAGDACLKLRDYDVPILPASSIMQSAIYWSIVAESERIALLERSL